MPRTPKAGTRSPLSRDRVVAAAIAIADHDGLDALSMRKLAQALGVEAMSLYHHVANKDALLDGMVDAVFAEIELPPTDIAWRPALRRRTSSVREAMLRHPWAIGRLDSRRSPGPATLRHHDAVLGCLRVGGFSVADAALAFATVDAFVYGFTMQELSLPFSPGEELAEVAAEMMAGMADAYPHLAEMVTERALQPGYDFADEFEPGLDLVLDSIERLHGGLDE